MIPFGVPLPVYATTPGVVYELTVFYPKKRVALILGAPTQLPASPLLRVPNPQKPVDADVEYEPIEEPMTMKCLFLSVTTMSEARKERLQAAVDALEGFFEARAGFAIDLFHGVLKRVQRADQIVILRIQIAFAFALFGKFLNRR